jgi:hypothetical protein
VRFTFRKFKPPPGMSILRDYFMGATAEKLPSKLATEMGSSAYRGATWLGAAAVRDAARGEGGGAVLMPPGIKKSMSVPARVRTGTRSIQ